MFRPQAQAETHSKLTGSPLASASGTYFFLFIYRLQAQAHRDPGSTPRASRKNLFFLFINRLQAQAQARSGPGERHALFY